MVGRAFGGNRGNALLRAKTILHNQNIPMMGSLERVAGASNEVWTADNFVLRVATSSITNRLESEAALLPYLPEAALVPKLLATGHESFGQWVLEERRP